MRMIKSKQEKVLGVIGIVIMTIIIVLIIFPFILLFMSSITDENTLLINGYSIFPKKINFQAYKYIWNSKSTVLRAYLVTICVTLIGTIVNVLITTMVSYPLSLADLPGKRVLTFFIIFTMLFNGGLVPTYMIYTNVLHIKNTYLALILPNLMFSSFNAIIMRTYFSNTIPTEIYDAARIDGASEFTIFGKIVIPLGKSIIVTVSIFSGLNYWNDWMNGLYYISDQSKYSIQQMLNVMVKNIQYLTQYGHSSGTGEALPSISLRMAIAFVAVIPILILYPFLQKYFESGVMLGAVKG